MAEKECVCNRELKELIFEEVRREGRMTFARFMDLALYHPESGYYTSSKQRVGKQGDFYTSPHVHPMFGVLLAKQIEEMWRTTGAGRGFEILEFGAGSGLLAQDILEALSRDCLAAVRYVIVEINPHLMETQRRRLARLNVDGGQVLWARNLEEVHSEKGDHVGCILSNELIDAFPVHRVKLEGRRLQEIYVASDGDRLVDTLDEPSMPELEGYLARNGVELADGQEIEINLRALEWLEGVARFLDRGFVLTVDYGYESRDLAGPKFYDGSLICYRQHRLCHDPYEAIGMQDLTAHVNFTALMNKGRAVGLETTGYTTQARFLLALVTASQTAGGALGTDALRGARALDGERKRVDLYRDKIALKQLVMPGGMGEIFKVLVQHKGLDTPKLTGLRSPW